MAFTASVTKQLGDLLQEQQEPFVLDIYLIDKGFRKNMLLSNTSTPNRFFKRASRSEVIHKRSKIISSCSSAVKALFDILKVKRRSGSQKTAEDTFLRKGQHRHENLVDEEEADTDIKIRKISDDRTQLSPVSVLEAMLSNEESHVHNQTIRNTKTVGEEVSSDICSDSYESLENLLSEKTSEVNKPDSYPQYTNVKLALQQTKQLLFDSVKEILETHRLKKKNRRQPLFGEPMGAEAIGKILCDNMLAWSTKSVDVNYSNQLIDIDMLDSAEEWNDSEQKKGIGMEIADYILEDICSDIVLILL